MAKFGRAMDIHIRPERDWDFEAVAAVVQDAYAQMDFSNGREYRMVESLRKTSSYVPELSLLARVGDSFVGHIMLTKISVGSPNQSFSGGLALAPLSVVPAFQRRGVGKGLVEEAHQRAMQLGFRFIVLVGPPGYYMRMGYQSLGMYPITLPFDAPLQNRMILPLVPEALSGVHGQVVFAPEWLDH